MVQACKNTKKCKGENREEKEKYMSERRPLPPGRKKCCCLSHALSVSHCLPASLRGFLLFPFALLSPCLSCSSCSFYFHSFPFYGDYGGDICLLFVSLFRRLPLLLPGSKGEGTNKSSLYIKQFPLPAAGRSSRHTEGYVVVMEAAAAAV